MGLVVQTAQSQCLRNTSPPIKAVPFTVGMWIYPFSTATASMWGIYDASANADLFQLFQNTIGNTWNIQVIRSTATTSGIGGVTVNQWQFCLCRFISATNRWLSVIRSDGTMAHVQGTASKTPIAANLVKEEIGADSNSTFGNGIFGEYWKTNSDIQADGGQTENELLWQLAYGGPFSVPHVARDVVDYKSLRQGLSSDQDELGEAYFGPLGAQTWAAIGSPVMGAHPPLSYQFRRPGARIVEPALISPVVPPATFNAGFLRSPSPIGVGIY